MNSDLKFFVTIFLVLLSVADGFFEASSSSNYWFNVFLLTTIANLLHFAFIVLALNLGLKIYEYTWSKTKKEKLSNILGLFSGILVLMIFYSGIEYIPYVGDYAYTINNGEQE